MDEVIFDFPSSCSDAEPFIGTMDAPEREEDLFKRPTPALIIQAWKALFSDPLVSLSKLQALALSKDGLGDEGPDGGVILRSVHWRFYHALLPSPTSPEVFGPSIEGSRNSYTTLRRRWLVAPDGRWASDCSYYPDIDVHTPPASGGGSGSATGAQATPPPPPLSPTSPKLPDSSVPATPTGWDPLSLDGSSPWKTWFAHQDLRATVRQDVERTFPDIPYFRIERVRTALTTALFMFSVMNPDVGYRQGMHELLAVCLLVVDRDSLEYTAPAEFESRLSPGSSSTAVIESAMRTALDRRYVEHDAFALFLEIMRGAKAFYEWRNEEGPRTTSPVAPQAPIILRCQNLHNSILRRVDPQLWERFETEGLEPQIWAIRWIRLILTRELPFHLAMRIWDGLFAEDPGLGMLDYVCVAMLLLIRNELIQSDYSGLLTNLLRYPSPSVDYPFHPHLILAQARALRSNVTPAGGVEIVLQNQEVLGVKAHPPEASTSVGSGASAASGLSRRGPPGAHGYPRGPGSGPGQSASPNRGVQGLAAGLFERAQAAGLDRTLLNTVADIRKNLPDAASAYSYLPNLPFSPGVVSNEKAAFSSIPSTSTLPPRSGFFSPPHISRTPPTQAAPPQPSSIFSSTLSPRPTPPRQPSMDSNISIKSLRDAERDMAELRLAMMGMGKAMAGWMDGVSAALTTAALSEATTAAGAEAEGDTGEKAGLSAAIGARGGAVLGGADWKGLERVRDTLLDAAGSEIDDIVRQWGWHDGLEAPASNTVSGAGSPSMSRSQSGTGSFVDLGGEAIHIKDLDLPAQGQGQGQVQTQQTGQAAFRPISTGAQGWKGGVGDEDVTPRQADTATMSRTAMPAPRPASVGVPNVTISSASSSAARGPARPTTMPPPGRFERIVSGSSRPAHAANVARPQSTSAGGSASGSNPGSGSMPRQLLLRPNMTGNSSTSTATQPQAVASRSNRPSLSERLSAASRPSSAVPSATPSPTARQASLSPGVTAAPSTGEAAAAAAGDPLAGMGIGVGVLSSGGGRKRDSGPVHDPLGAGH